MNSDQDKPKNDVNCESADDKAWDKKWMQQAISLAQTAQTNDEVPVGAVVVKDNHLIAKAYNCPIISCDPTAHAEIVALRQAGQILGNYRLTHTTLYVTLEPCAMCVGALVHARIDRLVFGAFDTKSGVVCSTAHWLNSPHFNHRIVWRGGVLLKPCEALLKHFFKERRQLKHDSNCRGQA